MCYHIRAVDALGFHGAILFSGHSGPHRLDVPVVIEIMQAHVGVRMYSSMSIGADVERFEDGKGLGGHAGRGETSVLWAVAPDCVDMSRMPTDDARAPHFAMGRFQRILQSPRRGTDGGRYCYAFWRKDDGVANGI